MAMLAASVALWTSRSSRRHGSEGSAKAAANSSSAYRASALAALSKSRAETFRDTRDDGNLSLQSIAHDRPPFNVGHEDPVRGHRKLYQSNVAGGAAGIDELLSRLSRELPEASTSTRQRADFPHQPKLLNGSCALISAIPSKRLAKVVATKAPTTPSSVVRMKPDGSFLPGIRNFPITPATKPLARRNPFLLMIWFCAQGREIIASAAGGSK
jgi:hypothetical protein